MKVYEISNICGTYVLKKEENKNFPKVGKQYTRKGIESRIVWEYRNNSEQVAWGFEKGFKETSEFCDMIDLYRRKFRGQ